MPSTARHAAGISGIGEREFVVLLAMLQALQALAIDAMLPALGEISGDLNVTDPNHRQLVVGVFLFGIGIGALLPGALADRYGRRPVLFVSLACYIVPVIACASCAISRRCWCCASSRRWAAPGCP
jgi:DHA1 family bicyclomycin/chloramphenicol resistance-like MFS transporter